MDEALGRGDRVADLVGDRGRELLEVPRVLTLERHLLAGYVHVDLLLDLVLDDPLAQAGLDHQAEIPARELEAPDDQQDEAQPGQRRDDQED